MPKLIKDKHIVTDTWGWLAVSDEPVESVVVPEGPTIIPVNVWLAQRDSLLARKADLGVWFSSEQNAELLGADAEGFGVIALNFHAFMDGRLFSTARILRERYGYTGELRATGSFIRDQLFYLKRCGVNAFAFADPATDLEACLASLDDFKDAYQGATDQPLPLFRRRA